MMVSTRFIKMFLLAGGLAAALLLGGCTKTVSEVAAFSDIGDNSAGTRYDILPSESQRESLEFETYARFVESRLAEEGWVRVPEDSLDADYTIVMSYNISAGIGASAFYERYFNLRIVPPEGGGPAVYEASATSFGTAGTFGRVGVCMIKGALKRFPEADSGQHIVSRSDCDK